MSVARTYPAGVPSWIDLEVRDLEAGRAFYGGLFGWAFEKAAGPGASYLVARLDGHEVAGLAGPVGDGTGPAARAGWNTYVTVTDVDEAATRVADAGGRVTQGPVDSGGRGRYAACEDPVGVPFRIRQGGGPPGAQRANEPGSWNFSDLHAEDPAASWPFYAAVFGWAVDDLGFASMIRRPGYGDHLAATTDPGIHERQAGVQAPPGFADAIGWLAPAGPDERPHWHVSFTVADRDATAEAAERLGGTVVARTESDWTREALVRDPVGGLFTASQFTPPQ